MVIKVRIREDVRNYIWAKGHIGREVKVSPKLNGDYKVMEKDLPSNYYLRREDFDIVEDTFKPK